MTTLLEEAEFDLSGAAVGLGRFNLPTSNGIKAPVQCTRVALWIGDAFSGMTARLYPIADEGTRGIFAPELTVVPTLELPTAFAVFLADHLRQPKPSAVGLDQQNGDDWPRFAKGGARLRFDYDGGPWLQPVTSTRVIISPKGEDRIVTIAAVFQGPARRIVSPDDEKQQFFANGAELAITLLVSRANQCVVFGAWPGDQGRSPSKRIQVSPQPTVHQLDARQALIGGGDVFAWSSKYAVLCWTGTDRPLNLQYAHYGRRADGLIEPNQQGAFVLELSKRRVEQLLRINREAELHLLCPRGELGYKCEYTGYFAADEGEHRRNVEELRCNFSIDETGLTMRLRVHLGEYLPATVRHTNPPPDSSEVRDIELKVFWETLILCQFRFQHHRKAILNQE